MATVEFLIARKLSASQRPIIEAMQQAVEAAGDQSVVTTQAKGDSDWMILAGIGATEHNQARHLQLSKGGRLLHWDHGYFDREKVVGHMRMCIDSDHPQQWLPATPPKATRWNAVGIQMDDLYAPGGHIVLVGLGRKSRKYLNAYYWEEQKLSDLRNRFPGRRIVFRPKGEDTKRLSCDTDTQEDITNVIRGASLVVCRHSNVAVDACIHGIPFECADGAAMYLQGKPYTVENRLDFLHRLAWWQWKSHEAAQAWDFAKKVVL